MGETGTSECCTPGCSNRTRYVHCTDCRPEEKLVPGSPPKTGKGRMRRDHERICSECGEGFLGTARAMTCSAECGRRRQKKQQQDYYRRRRQP